ncbi:MAG: hypothetical protein QF827_03195, partial [Alphaproteobacteria bacterium]|nr:hypothetical protein [Alphaproteobacteria bacterium]
QWVTGSIPVARTIGFKGLWDDLRRALRDWGWADGFVRPAIWARMFLGAAALVALVAVAVPVAAQERMTCLASDAQVARGETILCRRGDERFYESLATLHAQGWRLRVKLRARAQGATAYHLERDSPPEK